MSLYSGMYNKYCTFNDSRLGIIVIMIICCIVLLYSKCVYRKRMRDMQKKLDAINDARRKLINERGKLLREQYRY